MSALAAAVLVAFDVELVVVGGCALVLLGVERRCSDLDVVPEPSIENLTRLADALDALGATPPPQLAALADRPLTSVDTPYGRIDVLVGRARADYRVLVANASTYRVEDVDVRVASVDDVVRLRAQHEQSDDG